MLDIRRLTFVGTNRLSRLVETGSTICYLIKTVVRFKHHMKLMKKTNFGLDKKFQKVLRTPASFAFFVAIHDFIECIELNSVFSAGLSSRIKINRDLGIPTKYGHLKKIYQGLEDIGSRSSSDLGHERYMVICDLNRIQNDDVSENNSFWKKRELFRKLTADVYERLN